MKERMQAVIDSSARLQQIRARLAAIEDERVTLEAEAAGILQQLGVGKSGTGEWKDGRLQYPRRIIAFLAAHPTERFRVQAIAHELGASHPKQVHAVRQALARLSNEGRVEWIDAGTYAHKPGAV